MTTFWTTSLSVTKPHFTMSQSSDVNVHIWGTKRPTAVAGWQCHRRPKEAAECQRQKTPERSCLSVDATKAPESSCTLSTSQNSSEHLLSVKATKRSCTECQRQKRPREAAECRATKNRRKVRSVDAKKTAAARQSINHKATESICRVSRPQNAPKQLLSVNATLQ